MPTPPGLLHRLAAATTGNARGMVYALGAAFVFAVMHACMRHVTHDLGVHALVAVFYRSLFGVLLLVPVFMRTGIGRLKTRRPGLHFWRILCNTIAQIAFFWGVSLTPLAKVAALSFTAPLFATVIAVIFLGEIIRARRMTALVLGFIGVVLIVRPGAVPLDMGVALLLFSAFCWSIVLNLLKMLSSTESPLTMTFYLSFAMTPITFVAALFVWQVPDLEQLFWLVCIGGLGSLGQIMLAEGFKHAEASAMMPMDFTKLIWAVFIGLLLFGEQPDIWTLLGGTVIFASTFYITLRESRLRGKQEGRRRPPSDAR